MNEKDYFLILETQDNLREMLVFYVESEFNFRALRARNATEAVQLMADYNISFILCGDTASPEDSLNLFNFYCDSMLFKKVMFFDLRRDASLIDLENDNIRPHGRIPMGQALDQIRNLLKEHYKVNEQADVKDYTGISIESIPYFKGIEVDLYIQLPSGRHVKLYSEGDKVTQEDIQKYLEKNVKRLYIRKDTYEWVLKNLSIFAKDFASDPELKMEIHVDSQGIDEIIDTSYETIDMVHEKMQKMKKIVGQNKNLKKYLSSLKLNRKLETFITERIKLVSHISCGIAKELHWGSETTYENLIYSAYMHDVLLFPKPALAMMRDLEQFEKNMVHFSAKDKRIYLNHPEATAKIVEKDPQAPKEAYNIVKQHHELSNGEGFPVGLNHQRLTPFSCLFIFSLDLAHYILGNPGWTLDEYLNTYYNDQENPRYKGPVFHKIVRAAKKILK